MGLRAMSAAVALGALLWLPAAVAAEPTSANYSRCMDASGGVTADMLDCIGQELEAQDRRLNTAYRAVMASLGDARKAQLKSAQRLWIQYRDANCAFYDDPEGGSIARIEANSCVLQATAERAVELEALLQEY